MFHNFFTSSAKIKNWFKIFLLAGIVFLNLLQFLPMAQAVSCDNNPDNLPCTDTWFEPPPQEQVPPELSEPDLRAQIMKILNYILTFLGLVCVVGIIYSGGMMVTAMGNESQFKKGKEGIGYMVIGIVIILLSYSIVNWALNSGGAGTGGTTPPPIDQPDVPDTPWNGTGGSNTYNYYYNTYHYDYSQSNPTSNYNEYYDQYYSNYYTSHYPDVPQPPAPPAPPPPPPGTTDVAKYYNDYYNKYYYDYYSKYVPDLTQPPAPPPPPTPTSVNGGDEFNSQELEDSLNDLMNELNNYSFGDEYSDDLQQLINLLDIYLANPTDENWSNFINAYNDFWSSFEKLPIMQARITALPSSGNAPLKVTLDGLKSSDPKNQTIPDKNYTWTYLDEQGRTITLENKSVLTTEFPNPGTFVVNLKVETASLDNEGKKEVLDGYASQRITVNPSATQINLQINGEDVGTMYKVDLDSAKKGVTFDLSKSIPAPWRSFKQFKWDFGDGVYEEKFDLAPLEHAFGNGKEYSIEITAVDDFNKTYTKRISLLVKTIVAKINISPEGGNITSKFIFDAYKSKPNAEKIISYAWEIKDSENKTILQSEESSFEYKFEKPDKYEISLAIKDSYGGEDAVTQDFEVQSRPPQAEFDFSIKNSAQPNLVTFDAFRSYDPDGEQLLYDWDFDGNGVFEKEGIKETAIEYKFTQTGKFKTKLRVRDPFKNSSVAEKTVEIALLLNVDFSVNSYAATVGNELNFKALSDWAVAYYWNFGDGAIFQTDKAEIKHTFKQAGTYKVNLKAFDVKNNSNNVMKKVYIGNTNSPLAIAEILVDGKSVEPTADLCAQNQEGFTVYRTTGVTFSGGKSLNNSGKTENMEYNWDFGDGVYSNQKEVKHYYTELLPEKTCLKTFLTVKDKQTGAIAKSEPIFISVINQLPNLSYLEIVPQGKLVTPANFKLVARGFGDVDGVVLRYRWWYYKEGDTEKRGIQTTSAPFATMTIVGDGLPGQKNTYYFVAELTDDNNGVVNSSELFHNDVPFEIENGKNASPIVDFSVDKTMIYLGDSINFSAQASDPQGEAIPNDAYKWDFDGDGTFDDVSSGPQVSRRYNIPGEFNVRLKVDLNGLSTSKVKKIFVKRLNQYPEAAFIYAIDGKTVQFDATNSRYDEELQDKTLWYSWDFDTSVDEDGNGDPKDDNQANTVKAQFTYDKEKEYIVRLLVKDSLGSADYVERNFFIGGAGDVSGSASATGKQIESLKITSNKNLLTTLTLSMPEVIMQKGDTVDLKAQIIESSGELYNDLVIYRLLEGEGEFIPNEVSAKDGIAITTFKAGGPGPVVIEATAPYLLGGALSEQISFTVK